MLAVAVVGPLLGFLVLLAAMLAYPGFNQATQYLSELGGETAKHPGIFNFAVGLTGVGAFIAGGGFYFALLGVGGRRAPAVIAAALLGLGGIGLLIGAIFVYPDPRHLAIQLGFFIPFCPIALIWSLWGVPGFTGLRRFLALLILAMIVLIVVPTRYLTPFPGLVNSANVGWWERTQVAVLVGWVAIVALVLDRRLLRDGYWTREARREASSIARRS